mgnify:CR=1 FL=1
MKRFEFVRAMKYHEVKDETVVDSKPIGDPLTRRKGVVQYRGPIDLRAH